jgi:hypothetical protein
LGESKEFAEAQKQNKATKPKTDSTLLISIGSFPKSKPPIPTHPISKGFSGILCVVLYIYIYIYTYISHMPIVLSLHSHHTKTKTALSQLMSGPAKKSVRFR